MAIPTDPSRRVVLVGVGAVAVAAGHTTSARAGDKMSIRRIAPPGPGIPGISPGTLVQGTKLLLLSGHTPLDDAGKVVAGGLGPQLDRCFHNLSLTLRAADATFDNVARVTIYVRDYSVEQLPTIRSVRDSWVNADLPPASALIGVAALFLPEVLVEVDAIASIA